MLKVRDELLDGINHLSLGEVLLCKDVFQFLKEAIHLSHFMTGSLTDHTQSLETLHIYLLTRDVELFVGFFARGIGCEIPYRIFHK